MSSSIDFDDKKYNQDFIAAYSFAADETAAMSLLLRVASLSHTPSITLETITLLLIDSYERKGWRPGVEGARIMRDKPFYLVSRALADHPNSTPASLNILAEFLKEAEFLSRDEKSAALRQEVIALLSEAKERKENAQQTPARRLSP